MPLCQREQCQRERAAGRAVVDSEGGETHNSLGPLIIPFDKAFMIPRGLLVTLVFGLPILAIAFGVVLGASVLTRSLGDQAGASGLFWVAIGALVVLVIDALLLLIVLGLRALVAEENEERIP